MNGVQFPSTATAAGTRSPGPATALEVGLGRDHSRRDNNRRPPSGWAEKEVAMTKSPVARLRTERGVTTAEYAVVTAAGCGFASVLIKLLTSGWGQQLLKTLFELVLKVIGI